MRKPVTARAERKAREKELPWNCIPKAQHPLYQAALQKQWDQVLEYHAVEVLDETQTRWVLQNVPRERILNPRVLYRDKNISARTPDCPWTFWPRPGS